MGCKYTKKIIILTNLLFVLFLNNVYALDLNQARNNRDVGETYKGYIESIDNNASAEVSSLVSSVNEQRKMAYQDIATKTNTNIDSVAEIASVKLIQSAKDSNQCFKDKSSSGWLMIKDSKPVQCQ